jgi:hypothetical protein
MESIVDPHNLCDSKNEHSTMKETDGIVSENPSLPTAVDDTNKPNDESAQKLEQRWLGKVPFYVDPYDSGFFIHHENVVDLLHNTILTGHKIRFSSIDYPPNACHDEHGINLSLQKLTNDLRARAREHGATLISGGGSRPPICRSLICHRSLIATPRKPDLDEDANQKKRRRSKGTKRRLSSKDPYCPFRLNIYKDDVSFYLKIGNSSASAYHCYHCPEPPVDKTINDKTKKKKKPRSALDGPKQQRGKNSQPNATTQTATQPPSPQQQDKDLSITEDNDDYAMDSGSNQPPEKESYAFQLLYPRFHSLIQICQTYNATEKEIAALNRDLEKLEMKYKSRIENRSKKPTLGQLKDTGNKPWDK